MIHRSCRRGITHLKSLLWMLPILLSAAVLFWWWDRDPIDRAFGNFLGAVTATWDDDGRNMTLQRDFAYIDPAGKRWLAPTGSVINGASIPRMFWSVIGGPFEGRFRNASVLHDAACELQKESWQDVHGMFYNAMGCSRVGDGKAQTMYQAVYHFGPRWRKVAAFRSTGGQHAEVMSVAKAVPEQPQEEIVAKAMRYFSKKQFSPGEIEDCSVEDIEAEVARWDASNTQ